MSLKYQAVIYSDGTVCVHETILDATGNIKSASQEPVKLEAPSLGELDMLMRQIYSHMRKIKPITEDELDAAIYGAESVEEFLKESHEDDTVINLVDYFK